jgi:hypothetical protein
VRRSNVGHGRPQYVYQPPAERPIEPDGRVTPELALPEVPDPGIFDFLRLPHSPFARVRSHASTRTLSPARGVVPVPTTRVGSWCWATVLRHWSTSSRMNLRHLWQQHGTMKNSSFPIGRVKNAHGPLFGSLHRGVRDSQATGVAARCYSSCILNPYLNCRISGLCAE